MLETNFEKADGLGSSFHIIIYLFNTQLFPLLKVNQPNYFIFDHQNYQKRTGFFID